MGKTLFGLKVHSATGEITLRQSIMRSLAYFTCAITGSFLFALSYIRKDQKSLADVFSGTTVALDDGKEVKGTDFEMTLHTTLLMIRDDEMNTEDTSETYEEKKAA